MRYLLFFSSLFLVFSQYCDGQDYDYAEDVSSNSFFRQITILAKQLEVFPVDFIAPNGPFSDKAQGRDNCRGTYRLDITQEQFRYFYSFCDLALRVSEEDITQLMGNIDKFSPRERALILTTVYMYAYPWVKDRKLPQNMFAWKLPWLELVLRLTSCFGDIERIGVEMSPQKREAYRQFIEKYIQDDSVAFPSVEIPEENKKEFRIQLEYDLKARIYKMNIDDKFKTDEDCRFDTRLQMYLGHRMLCQVVREKEPNLYKDFVSDLLFASYVSYCWQGYDFYSNFEPWYYQTSPSRASNSSSTPKTVGQIATQLLESWEPVELEGNVMNP